LGLLPIERVKKEKTTRSHRPRGASRPGQDSLGGKNPGFRSACPASARHRSPNPSPKTESQLKRGQPNSFPTRPDGRTAASGCPAPGGMPPWAPANSLPAGEDPESSKSSSSTHSIGRRRKKFKSPFIPLFQRGKRPGDSSNSRKEPLLPLEKGGREGFRGRPFQNPKLLPFFLLPNLFVFVAQKAPKDSLPSKKKGGDNSALLIRPKSR
jgi:hypothetical protein